MRYKLSFTMLIFMIIILVAKSGFCQASDPESKNNALKSLISTIGKDFSHVLSSPFRMSKNDALQLASFAALNIVFIYNIDSKADEELALGEPHSFLTIADGLADIGDRYDKIGSGKVTAGFSAAMFAGGMIFKDKKLLETTRLLIESSILTGTITYVSKGLFSRLRPYTNEGPHNFNVFKFSNKYESRAFPSGHSSHIFSMMTVLAKQYDTRWVKIPAYTLAVSVALQRMDDRQHWGSDVFIGGLIGYWVSSTLVNRNKNKLRKNSISPYSSRNGFGIKVNF